MALDLRDCEFFGPALPEPFVKFQLEQHLNKRKLLPAATGAEGKHLRERWDVYRRKLRLLGERGLERRVASHVLEPLVELLGYTEIEYQQSEVITREGAENAGYLMKGKNGAQLRTWSVAVDTDLDAPNRRGRAYRFSPNRVAQRVLLAQNERVGLLTDGVELRLLICDPAKPESRISIRLDRTNGWRSPRQTQVPDSLRLLLALASPKGISAVSDLTEEARLAQSTVTRKLRTQARRAVEGFIQEVIDHPANAQARSTWTDTDAVARQLWKEGLILVYRLLFVFKLESSADPARAFSFAATSLWRNSYSPNLALGRLVRRVIDQGADTGGMLEGGLRSLFRLFAEGLSSSELQVKPLGGMLFGRDTTPLLDSLTWGEHSVAHFLDNLLWTPGDGKTERERVHYGALDVEDLGRVYEALLELEPGISTEPVCRLRRAKLEVVVPAKQGDPYRKNLAAGDQETDDSEDEADEEETEGKGKKSGKTKVQFIEDIPKGRFYLRVGLGRKATGSYYTPHPFVRFLVQETLGPQVAERSTPEDPHPEKILDINVLDPAMGSGHFLVEACRYLGDKLYEACRLCDERALEADEQAEKAKTEGGKESHLARAQELRKRVEDLPDPEDELVAYLPSRVPEGEETGLSQRKAEALCRRLVAVHCLYGVDKNPLAVELAKLSLWLESYAEGLPLTFLDHRLVCGDSLTGPFFEHLLTWPSSGKPLTGLFVKGLTDKLTRTLHSALTHVQNLEASIGKDIADLELKKVAKANLDAALTPFKTLAAAWTGGVMLADSRCDKSYSDLANAVVEGEDPQPLLDEEPLLQKMLELGLSGIPFDLTFPELFRLNGSKREGGFHAVLGNPPWDTITISDKDFGVAFEPALLSSRGTETKRLLQILFTKHPHLSAAYTRLKENMRSERRLKENLAYYHLAEREKIGHSDEFQIFSCRFFHLARTAAKIALVLPASFYAGEPAAACRETLLLRSTPSILLGISNSKRYFDIAMVAKFCLLVSSKTEAPRDATFRGRFQVKDFAEVINDDRWEHGLQYPIIIVADATGPLHLVFETSSQRSLLVLQHLLASTGRNVGDQLDSIPIDLIQEFNTTSRDSLTQPVPASCADPKNWRQVTAFLKQGLSPLAEAKTFYAYDWHYMGMAGSSWDPMPRKLVRFREFSPLTPRLPMYRLAVRRTVGSVETNERSLVAAILPPGITVADSAVVERDACLRPLHKALSIAAVFNTYTLDFAARLLVNSNMNDFLLRSLPWCNIDHAVPFLCHCALRLTATASEYEFLWTDVLGNTWREPNDRYAWPVLERDDTRWKVRAVIDAVVAEAYGLDRAQYQHVLSTFSHKSYPKAPELCLAAFDELKSIGLEAFTKKHDPYWDIPLNEELPKPVIDLPNGDGVTETGKRRVEKSGQVQLLPMDDGPLFGRRKKGR